MSKTHYEVIIGYSISATEPKTNGEAVSIQYGSVTNQRMREIMDLFVSAPPAILRSLTKLTEIRAELDKQSRKLLSGQDDWDVTVNESIPIGERWKIGAPNPYTHLLYKEKLVYTKLNGQYLIPMIGIERRAKDRR